MFSNFAKNGLWTKAILISITLMYIIPTVEIAISKLC